MKKLIYQLKEKTSPFYFALALVVLLFGVAIAVTKPVKANHAGCVNGTTKLFDRCTQHGYFTNQNMGPFGTSTYIWPGGHQDADPASPNFDINSAAKFKQVIQDGLSLGSANCGTNPDPHGPCVSLQSERVGAAFIVLTMLGVNGTDFTNREAGVTEARNRRVEWNALVDYYAANNLIQWNHIQSYSAGQSRPDSLAINYGTDVAFYQNTDASITSGPNQNNRFIRFTDANDPTKYFMINKKCGNVTGRVTPPTPPPDPYDARCEIDAPSDISVSSTFFVNFTVENTGLNTLNEADLSMVSPTNPSGWGKQTFPVQVLDGTTIPPGGSATWRESGFTTPATPGDYDFRWNIVRNNVVLGTCNTRINVSPPANRPIIRANGGDIIAGANFAGYDYKTCNQYHQTTLVPTVPGKPANTNMGKISARAHIDTWGILDYHSGGGRYGMLGASSSQYTVISSGEAGYEFDEDDFDRAHLNHILGNDGWIQDIDDNPNNGPSPDQNVAVPDFTSTKDAVMTNDKGKGGEYGNYYKDITGVSAYLPCVDIKEYTDTGKDRSAVNPPTQSLASALSTSSPYVKFTPGSGTLVINNSNQLLSPFPAAGAPRKKVIIVEGNIDIRKNICYITCSGEPTYNGVNDIPYLQLIATGKINIYKNVERIDAHLMAFPRNPNPYDPVAPGSGIIDTCADANNAYIGKWPDGQAAGGGAITATGPTSCNNQLVVNGSLVSRRIYLKRTLGTMSSDINNLNNSIAPYSCRIQNGTDPNGGTIGDKDFNRLAERYNDCAAELFNFYPEAYISNMHVVDEAIGVQSVPVDSIELPPVY
jgi:hypothetical protein